VELIRPNWHIILIHYPLALLSLGIVIELLSFLWRRSGFRAAGRWMILLGALLCLPTVTTGIYAFRDVVGGNDGMTWIARKANATLSQAQWRLLIEHMWWNVGGTAAFIVAVIVWLASSNRWRDRLHWPLLAVVIVGMICLIFGAWHGGEMVYGHGLAVAQVDPAAASPVLHGTEAKAQEGETLEQVVPPMELHLFLAGLTFAMAAAALGLSYRSLAEIRMAEITDTEDTLTEESEARPYRGVPEHDERIVDALRGEEAVVILPPHMPPARFWLLAALLGILTALAGLWLVGIISPPQQIFSWPDLQHEFAHSHRDAAHILFGGGIVVLSLILAVLTRWARRSGLLLSIFSLLLVLAVAGQIWLGVLLAFDSMQGSLVRFNPPAAAATAPH
jgi:uncharacterized membrane protein